MPKIYCPSAICIDDLIDDFLTHEYYNRDAGRKITSKDLQDFYLDRLKNTLDFICGKPQAPGALLSGDFHYGRHQRYFAKKAYKGMVKKMYNLLKDLVPGDFEDFERLHDHVEKIKKENKKDSNGFGPTAIYDFSLSFAWNHFRKTGDRHLLPKDFVYLHAGPMRSAALLMVAGKLKSIGVRVPVMDFHVPIFPSPLLGAKEMENFLCHYFGDIQRLSDLGLL